MAPVRGAAGGPSACFGIGILTFELCCLPFPRPECWDEVFTPERCCVQEPGCFDAHFTREFCCGPSSSPDCWDGAYTRERCCGRLAAPDPPKALVVAPAAALDSARAAEGTAGAEAEALAAEGGARGNAACWGGLFTYEACCAPITQPFCFDMLYFTAERCCSSSSWRPGPLDRLRAELLTNTDPFRLLELIPYPAAEAPSYSPLTAWLVRQIVGLLGPPALWLEVGCALGATAILTASTLKSMGLQAAVVCIDPFTGGVEEWAEWGVRPQIGGGLRMDIFGHVRLYETFLANIHAAGLQDAVMPLRVSSISGLRTFLQLYQESRLTQPTSAVFLGGTAHEEAEMLLEARVAWRLLSAPGVLLGECWPHQPAVWGDVTAFARELKLPRLPVAVLRRLEAPTHRVSEPEPGLALLTPAPGAQAIWLMPKGEWG